MSCCAFMNWSISKEPDTSCEPVVAVEKFSTVASTRVKPMVSGLSAMLSKQQLQSRFSISFLLSHVEGCDLHVCLEVKLCVVLLVTIGIQKINPRCLRESWYRGCYWWIVTVWCTSHPGWRLKLYFALEAVKRLHPCIFFVGLKE